MPFLTWANVRLRIGKQIVWTKRKQVEFADIGVIKVISACQTDKERLVPIFAHKLVEFLPNMIHLLIRLSRL
jgi:hypothetical protein